MIGGTKVGRGSQEIVLATKSYGEVELRDQERWSYLVDIEHLERPVEDRPVVINDSQNRQNILCVPVLGPACGLAFFCPLGTPA